MNSLAPLDSASCRQKITCLCILDFYTPTILLGTIRSFYSEVVDDGAKVLLASATTPPVLGVAVIFR